MSYLYLYLLKSKEPVNREEMQSCVVSAADAPTARELASSSMQAGSSERWQSPIMSSCEIIGESCIREQIVCVAVQR
jgi:hypothetical protein